MEIYRVTKDSPEWQFKAYDYIRTDAFCFGQHIPVEMEFNGDGDRENFNGILVIEDHVPVCGLRISYPRPDIGKIERVCTVREKQKGGYGRVMIAEAEKWIAERGISHVVISSQDRARGFYEKCGYVYNPDVSPSVYDTHKRPAGPRPERPIGFKADFVCVLVEKFLDIPENSKKKVVPETAHEYGIATRCIYGNGQKAVNDPTGAISFPIYQSATYAHPEVGKSTGFDYSRLQNPTRAQAERVVCALEGGVDALAFSTGMAAIGAVMELFGPGDHIITEADLYGGSTRLFNNISEKNGITFSHISCSTEDVESFIKDSTKAIFIETPTNPMMSVTDIAKTAEIAHRHGLLLIVDNTFLSPYFQNPLALGADIVIHSGTKFLGGHNDTLAGFVVVSSKEISGKLRFIIKTVGSGLSPMDSWLILRGIKTLPVRMEKAQENAMAIARFLQNEPRVKKVYYPGLPEHPGHEICKKQARGFGSMLTFELESEELARSILKNTRLIPFAESLGGVETLLTYPVTQTHADVPADVRESLGINERVLRLSAGIEDKADLIADLKQAFEHEA